VRTRVECSSPVPSQGESSANTSVGQMKPLLPLLLLSMEAEVVGGGEEVVLQLEEGAVCHSVVEVEGHRTAALVVATS
jgi:hypothetical protein